MGREEILGAIERTAREIDICGYQAPKAVCPTTLADMNQYREFQEQALNAYDAAHPGPLRAIARAIIAPVGFVLSPAILAGGLVWFGGREVYRRIRA